MADDIERFTTEIGHLGRAGNRQATHAARFADLLDDCLGHVPLGGYLHNEILAALRAYDAQRG